MGKGDHAALARVLSLLEQGHTGARSFVAELRAEPDTTHSVGITGAPGAGKSSLADQLIRRIRQSDEQVSMLAVDPSSPKTGGAILGDRIRMGAHARDPGVFIRSIATRGQLGGLAAVVPDALRLLACSGVPWLLIETVGVGQVELDIAGTADTTVLVVYPGWGDSIQANKAGLLEVADVLVVNKSDRPGSDGAVRDLVAMLTSTPNDGWSPPVIETVATSGAGIEALWQAILSHREYLSLRGIPPHRSAERLRAEVVVNVKNRLSMLVDEWCRRAPFDEITRTRRDPHQIADILVRQILDAAGASQESP